MVVANSSTLLRRWLHVHCFWSSEEPDCAGGVRAAIQSSDWQGGDVYQLVVQELQESWLKEAAC